MYAFGSVIATISYTHSAVTHHDRRHAHIGFFEGYTPLAILLVLFQARTPPPSHGAHTTPLSPGEDHPNILADSTDATSLNRAVYRCRR